MSEIKLLPCPFCGGEAWIKERKIRFPKDVHYIPQCRNEHCMGRNNRVYDTRYHAAAAWNHRAGGSTERIERWHEEWVYPGET